MRNAENCQRVICEIFMRNHSAFYPLSILRILHSEFYYSPKGGGKMRNIGYVVINSSSSISEYN